MRLHLGGVERVLSSASHVCHEMGEEERSSPYKYYDILAMCLVCLSVYSAGYKSEVDEQRLNKTGDHKLLKGVRRMM